MTRAGFRFRLLFSAHQAAVRCLTVRGMLSALLSRLSMQRKAFQLTGAITQNVNWAIKSDYRLSLAEMIPDASLPSRAAPFSPVAATACIGLVSAW